MRRPGAWLLPLFLLGILTAGITLSSTVVPSTRGQVSPNATTGQTHRTFFLRGIAALGWNGTRPGPLIQVTSGDLVTILLISDDGLMHSWFTDYDNNGVQDPGEITSLFFSSTTTVLNFTFTPFIGKNVPSAGDFTYRCAVHPFLMFGTFRVLPLTVAASTTLSLDGSMVSTVGSLTLDTRFFNVSTSLTVTSVNTTTGLTNFAKTYVLSNLKMQNVSGTMVLKFLLNVAVLPYKLSSDISLQLQGTVASVMVVLTRQLDINGDGSVEILDAEAVVSAFGSVKGGPNYNPLADFNGDGFVNVLDASVFANFFFAQAFK